MYKFLFYSKWLQTEQNIYVLHLFITVTHQHVCRKFFELYDFFSCLNVERYKKFALNILILCFHRCPKCSPVFSNRCAKMSLTECGWTSCMFPVKLQYYWWDRGSWISGCVHGILEILNQGLQCKTKKKLAFFPCWILIVQVSLCFVTFAVVLPVSTDPCISW